MPFKFSLEWYVVPSMRTIIFWGGGPLHLKDFKALKRVDSPIGESTPSELCGIQDRLFPLLSRSAANRSRVE